MEPLLMYEAFRRHGVDYGDPRDELVMRENNSVTDRIIIPWGDAVKMALWILRQEGVVEQGNYSSEKPIYILGMVYFANEKEES